MSPTRYSTAPIVSCSLANRRWANFPRKQSRCWRRSPRSPKHIGRPGALLFNANSRSRRQRLLARDRMASLVEHALYTVPCDLVLVPTRGGMVARAISRFKPPVWIIAPSSDCAACQNLAFSYGVYPINLAEEPDDWREWIARWLRENGITAERVMLVAGPSPRNPKANYRIELMRLDAENASTAEAICKTKVQQASLL